MGGKEVFSFQEFFFLVKASQLRIPDASTFALSGLPPREVLLLGEGLRASLARPVAWFAAEAGAWRAGWVASEVPTGFPKRPVTVFPFATVISATVLSPFGQTRDMSCRHVLHGECQ